MSSSYMQFKINRIDFTVFYDETKRANKTKQNNQQHALIN